jgi:hypothetical protein
VTLDEYQSLDSCWGGADGFKAKVILSPTSNNSYTPRFISVSCRLDQPNLPGWFAVVSYPHIPGIVGDGGKFKSLRLLDKEISTNLIDHLPKINDSDRIYALSAQLERKTSDLPFPIYQYGRIESFQPTGETFADFRESPCFSK